MLHPTGRSIFRFLITVAVAIICVAALTIALTIWWLRSEAIAAAFRDFQQPCRGALRPNRKFHSIYRFDFKRIKAEEEFRSAQMPNGFHHISRSENTFQYLIERLSHLTQAAFITLVDNKGKIVNTTLQWPTPAVDLSDRPYFQYFSNTDDIRLYISMLSSIASSERSSFLLVSASMMPTTPSSARFWSVSASPISKRSMNLSHPCPINLLCYCTATAPSSYVILILSNRGV